MIKVDVSKDWAMIILLFGVVIVGYVIGLDVDAIVGLWECHGLMHHVFELDWGEVEVDGANMAMKCWYRYNSHS